MAPEDNVGTLEEASDLESENHVFDGPPPDSSRSQSIFRSEDPFQLLVDSVTEYAIFFLDTAGYVATWNVGAQRIKGYAEAEAIGRHFSIFYTPDDIERDLPNEALRLALLNGRYEEESGWRVRKDGTRFLANVVISVVKDKDGRHIGFSKVTRDITDRKYAEKARLQVARDRAAIQSSQEQFRMLVESVSEYAIFLLDAAGHVTTWNAGAARIKGYTAREIIGKHFSVFYTPEDRARNHPNEELRMAVKEGRFEEEGWRVRKNGTRFLASVVIAPLYDKGGGVIGFSKVTRDITERKKSQDAHLQQMRDEISRTFLRDVLFSVTEGKLRFADARDELPAKLATVSGRQALNCEDLSTIRANVRNVAYEAGFSELRTIDLLTAVGEAAMNAVVHAKDAEYEIFAGDGVIQVWIEDKGRGIELSQLHRATLERGYTTGGTLGHGFWLILRMCDRIWLQSNTAGTTVVIEQEATVPDPAWLTAGKTNSA